MDPGMITLITAYSNGALYADGVHTSSWHLCDGQFLTTGCRLPAARVAPAPQPVEEPAAAEEAKRVATNTEGWYEDMEELVVQELEAAVSQFTLDTIYAIKSRISHTGILDAGFFWVSPSGKKKVFYA